MPDTANIEIIKEKIQKHIADEAESICENYPISFQQALSLILEWLIDNPVSYRVDSVWIKQFLIDREDE